MADAVGNKAAKDYHIGTPTPDQGFFAKGLGHTDWGMKNRISRLFSPETGNAVMLAFDHGYIMGSTAGLERLDVSIAPLCEYADVLMGTRGAIRSCIPPTTGKAVCLRATHDSSVLFEDMSQGSGLALDMEDALRMNAAALAIQCFVGGAGERDSLEALCRAADAGYKYGVPILGVTAVGKEMARTTQYFLLATRILAELGASAVKTYYCEDFEKVASACPGDGLQGHVERREGRRYGPEHLPVRAPRGHVPRRSRRGPPGLRRKARLRILSRTRKRINTKNRAAQKAARARKRGRGPSANAARPSAWHFKV